jgi:uncharacterized Zn finger protein
MTAAGGRQPDYVPARPLAREGGIAVRSPDGAIGQTWWSRRFLELLESFGLGSRLERGLAYARAGQVIELDVEPGIVLARVQGSRYTPYRVRIRPAAFSEHQWRRAEKAIGARALTLARLLAGEMPPDIEEVLAERKLALLPRSYGELRASCDCPDAVNPCKHTAAVYYILAERFDADPFALFTWRGRTKEELIESLRPRRAKAGGGGGRSARLTAAPAHDPAPPLVDVLDRFWSSGPELQSLRVSPLAGEAPDAILRQLGPAPDSVGGEELVALLASAYARLAAGAERRALAE